MEYNKKEGSKTNRGTGPFLPLVVLALVLSLSGGAQESRVPRSMVVYKSMEPLTIDGQAHEASWGKAPWSESFIDIEGEREPAFDTRMKMLWDDTYLYFYAQLEEPHIWGYLKQRDTVIFYNNDFEIFIDPDGDTHNYYEFEMNALNTVWDLFLAKPYREGGPVLDSWDIAGLKTAVHHQGSLNDPSDRDQGWSVEVAMPWAVLLEASGGNDLPVSQFWRVNFSRVNWDFDLEGGTYRRKRDAQGGTLPEYNWVWSPQWVINMHEPEHWGYAYFSANPVGTPEEFSIPREEEIRWLFYRVYRAQKSYHGRHGSYARDLDSLGIEARLGDGTSILPELGVHVAGWTLRAKSPFTGRLYQIREDGKFQEIQTKP